MTGPKKGGGRVADRPGSSKNTGRGARPESNRTVASNRRARHDYDILDTVECGLVLQGSEVKSLRAGRIALQDAYARIIDGEMWLFGVHVPPYAQANGFGAHEPDRRRKLLLHRRQLDEWMGRSQQQSLTMVPLSIYFKDGRAKVELALARGRRQYDKRHAIARRDAEREAAREARAVARGRPGK
ncbi:MAG TPA: SsrA-binding protein SmpB [Acidimicrobiales bacterium]|jgi:SsrA-binding protein|nr:SsrA-binding protein SmpB [Acidimicrobiales bacterium]